jgi:hypothetical protein
LSSFSYDVVIVGCGPAGIFSALELVQKTSLRILMIDRGPDLDRRSVKKLECPTHYLSGWGGAGAFSDGKLTMSTAIGGILSDYVPRSEMERLTTYVDNLYIRFGAPQLLYGTDEGKVGETERRATLAGMKLVRSRIRHLGSENCIKVLKEIRGYLQNKLEIKTGTGELESLLMKIESWGSRQMLEACLQGT